MQWYEIFTKHQLLSDGEVKLKQATTYQADISRWTGYSGMLAQCGLTSRCGALIGITATLSSGRYFPTPGRLLTGKFLQKINFLHFLIITKDTKVKTCVFAFSFYVEPSVNTFSASYCIAPHVNNTPDKPKQTHFKIFTNFEF